MRWRSFTSVALGVAWRTVHNVLHNPSLLYPGILFPLLNFMAFAGDPCLCRFQSSYYFSLHFYRREW